MCSSLCILIKRPEHTPFHSGSTRSSALSDCTQVHGICDKFIVSLKEKKDYMNYS